MEKCEILKCKLLGKSGMILGKIAIYSPQMNMSDKLEICEREYKCLTVDLYDFIYITFEEYAANL